MNSNIGSYSFSVQKFNEQAMNDLGDRYQDMDVLPANGGLKS